MFTLFFRPGTTPRAGLRRSLASLLLLAAPWVSAMERGLLEIVYPLDGTLFPPEIVAPNFRWEDATPAVTRWQVSFGDAQPASFTTTEAQWRPTAAVWDDMKQRSTGAPMTVSITGQNATGDALSFAGTTIRTSTDPVGDAIFYREVPLPFIDAVQDPSRIRWRFGSIDSPDRPPIVLDNLPVCGNCHSFSQDGSKLGLDVDYGNDKGGYAILSVEQDMLLNDEKIITWSDYKREDGEATFGLLSQVSPDGRYVISTVKDRAVFVATPGIEYSQLFFPIKGILVVYDTKTGVYQPLPGADDPAYVQSNPTWSPDGQHVVFARAKVYEKPSIANANSILLDQHDVPEFIEDNEPFKFDLYRVPFNEGRGGKAEPIAGASHNGRSNFFAKYSPDGKWIVFTQAEDYMLLMPDSELFIIPAEGGDARRLQANTPNMNSWHSFSSNGKWLVFSSKVFSPYTQLFLTHIDEQGRSTPPVVLDQFTEPDRAANIPEFVPIPANSIARITEQFLDAYSFLRAGMAKERTGNYPGAVKAYERGLAVEPENVELLNAKGFALFQQGESAMAVATLENALAADPQHWKAHNNMALASIDLGELEMAEAHYRESLAIEPQPAIYNDLGFVLERQGLIEEAVEAYRESIALDPTSSAAHYNLGSALARDQELVDAEKHLRISLAQKPSSQAHTGLALVLWQQNQSEAAVAELEKAVEVDPGNVAAHEALGKIYTAMGNLPAAARAYRRVNELQPGGAASGATGKDSKQLQPPSSAQLLN